MSKALDLLNKQFGRLLVIAREGSDKNGRSLWRCQCNCRNQVIIQGKRLSSGHTKSCGCISRDQLIAASTTHGLRHSLTYTSWYAMKARCHRSTAHNYARYGALGVKVCDRWQNSFENFYADMGARPSPKHSIDRIDPYGDYEPGNCRWADALTQRHNRRNKGWQHEPISV